jgi:hypothetical protein
MDSDVAEIVLHRGVVEIDTEEGETWAPGSAADRGDDWTGSPLPRDATVKTRSDGRLKVALGGTYVWIDGESELQILGPSDVRLRRGRVGVSKRGTEKPFRLLTPFGIVEQDAEVVGALTAWATPERLLVACLDGEMTLSDLRRERVRIEAGRLGVVTAGCLLAPERAADRETFAAWMRHFDAVGPAEKAMDAGVWRPRVSRKSALSTGTQLEELSLEVLLRGPLVAVRSRAKLRIPPGETIPSRPQPRDLVFPAPDAASVIVDSPAGPSTELTVQIASVSVMEPTGERFCFALLPGAWTTAPMRIVSVTVEGRAVGGIQELESNLRDLRVEHDRLGVSAMWRGGDVSLSRPLVFAVTFREPAGADLVLLAAGEGGKTAGGTDEAVVGAWDVSQPDADRRPFATVILGVDATGGYGPNGLDTVCTLAEALIDQLLPHRFGGLLLYDGAELTVLQYPSPREIEGIARDIRAALWSVVPAPTAGDGTAFLRRALDAERLAEPGEYLVLITDGNPRLAEEVGALAPGLDLAGALVVEMGLGAPASGCRPDKPHPGVDVLRLGPEVDPVAAAQALLGNLPWRTGGSRRLTIGEGGEVVRALPSRSTFGNRPVAALARFEKGVNAAIVGLATGGNRATPATQWEVALDRSEAFGPVGVR